ncbi:hypothetical protein ACLB2K_013035 [Fragaria x ananassa]
MAAIPKQYAEETTTREAAEENKKALQCQNVKLTVDEHVFAKKIELPSNQSNGENFLLDEPTSKEEITLSINDEKNLWSRPLRLWIIILSQKLTVFLKKKEHEDRIEQSILEEEIGSNTDDGETQFHMKGDQGASFPLRDVYVNTSQMHGGQGVARLHSLINHHD